MDKTDYIMALYKLVESDEMPPAQQAALKALVGGLEEQQQTLTVHQDLECGCTLKMLLHPWGEHRWFFEHRYILEDPEDPHGRVRALCEWKAHVDYKWGELQPQLVVSMYIAIPERLGKRFAYGVDISPGAKTYLEFQYKQDGASCESFWLDTVRKGVDAPVPMKDMIRPREPGQLIQPVQLPWPLVISDRIEMPWKDPESDERFGDYRIPFPVRTEDHTDKVCWVPFPPALAQ